MIVESENIVIRLQNKETPRHVFDYVCSDKRFETIEEAKRYIDDGELPARYFRYKPVSIDRIKIIREKLVDL